MSNGQRQCQATPAVMGNIAIKRLIENSPLSSRLEKWLSVPSLSAIYTDMSFYPDDPEESICGPTTTYDSLDSKTGDMHPDVHQVDLIVLELEKYIPHCTIGFSKGTSLVHIHKIANQQAQQARNKRKRQAPSQAQRYAESQDNETDDKQSTPPPKKKRQRRRRSKAHD